MTSKKEGGEEETKKIEWAREDENFGGDGSALIRFSSSFEVCLVSARRKMELGHRRGEVNIEVELGKQLILKSEQCRRALQKINSSAIMLCGRIAIQHVLGCR